MKLRPDDMGTFQFVVVAAMRAKQLARGCVRRVDIGNKPASIARYEVAAGKVAPLHPAGPLTGEPYGP